MLFPRYSWYQDKSYATKRFLFLTRSWYSTIFYADNLIIGTQYVLLSLQFSVFHVVLICWGFFWSTFCLFWGVFGVFFFLLFCCQIRINWVTLKQLCFPLFSCFFFKLCIYRMSLLMLFVCVCVNLPFFCFFLFVLFWFVMLYVHIIECNALLINF